METEGLMEALSDVLGVPQPAPSADGEYEMTFDAMTVRFIPRGKAEIVLSGLAGEVPDNESDASDLLKKLLRLNLALAKERREVLCAEGRKLVLYRRVRIDAMNGQEFVRLVETFLNRLESWRSQASGVRERPLAAVFYP